MDFVGASIVLCMYHAQIYKLNIFLYLMKSHKTNLKSLKLETQHVAMKSVLVDNDLLVKSAEFC